MQKTNSPAAGMGHVTDSEDVLMETCRFYQAQWPEEGQVVMARVTELGDTKAYVTLHEYADKDAMLPYSELSNRRLRSLHKHVRMGQLLCLRVTRVDPEKRYIDVSKRQVTEDDDRRACQQRYTKGKVVQSIIRRVGQLLGMTSVLQLEELNARTAWKLDTLYDKQTAAYDVFSQAYSNPDILSDLELDDETLRCFINVINHRFSLKQVKIRADVELMCLGRDGVDAIKEALRAGKAAAGATFPVQVWVMAAPVYTVTCSAMSNQRTEAMRAVEKATAAIKNIISNCPGGYFSIRQMTSVVDECVDPEGED